MSAVDMRDKAATCVVLEMILKHTADVFETLLEIVGEKYDIERDEMFEVIQAHPKWKGMVVDPALHALTAAEPVAEPVEPVPAQAEPAATKPKRQWSEEAKAAAAAKRAARKAAVPVPSEPVPAPSEPITQGPTEPAPSTEPKVVRKFVIKPKSKPVDSL